MGGCELRAALPHYARFHDSHADGVDVFAQDVMVARRCEGKKLLFSGTHVRGALQVRAGMQSRHDAGRACARGCEARVSCAPGGARDTPCERGNQVR